MNLMQSPRPDYSISHFARPQSWELDGRDFDLVMDDGCDVRLRFAGRKVAFAREGRGEGGPYDYLCFKADDETFFVSFEVRREESHIYVLDFAQRLVTRLICERGAHPKSPYILDRRYTFGALRLPGYRLPWRRHSFTSAHFGTAVQWRWSPKLTTKHAYLESDWYRITWDDTGEAADDFDLYMETLPSNDEKAQYVKIKENMILFSVTEEMQERFFGDSQHFRNNNLTLLQNYDRMFQVGRGYGEVVLPDGVLRHINIPLCAYGAPPALPEGFLEAANPYTV